MNNFKRSIGDMKKNMKEIIKNVGEFITRSYKIWMIIDKNKKGW